MSMVWPNSKIEVQVSTFQSLFYQNNAGKDTANSVQTITQTLPIKGQELNQITIFLVAVAAAFIEIFAADDVIFLHKVLNTNHSHFILPSSF